MNFYKGYSAFSKDEIGEIRKENGGPDVMIIGMNPSFSASIFQQVRRNNQEEFDELFLDLRRELQSDSTRLRSNEIARLLTDNKLRHLFELSPKHQEKVTPEQEKVLRELQYFFLNGRKKVSGSLDWMKVGEEVKSISYFDTIRKVLRHLSEDTTWYHEDLVDIRETDQKELIKELKNTEWEGHVRDCWSSIREVKPKVLLIANSTVAEKLFSNWNDIYVNIPGNNSTGSKRSYPAQGELEWDNEFHRGLCVGSTDSEKPEIAWRGPVVFSRQLSGGCSKAMMHYCLRDLYNSLHGVR